MTSTSSTSAERSNENTSSEAKPVVCVSSAPAMPGVAGGERVDATSRALTEMPIGGRAQRVVLIARSDRPNGELTMRRASRNSTNSTTSE